MFREKADSRGADLRKSAPCGEPHNKNLKMAYLRLSHGPALRVGVELRRINGECEKCVLISD